MAFSIRAIRGKELNKNLDMRPHFFKASVIWATPKVRRRSRVAEVSSTTGRSPSADRGVGQTCDDLATRTKART